MLSHYTHGAKCINHRRARYIHTNMTKFAPKSKISRNRNVAISWNMYPLRNGTSQNKHSNNAHRTRILVPLFTLNPPFLFPRGRASSNTFCLRVFTLSLPPRLSSREPTHFTVPDLRLATRGTTERGNYRGSDYLANRREIIARDASEGATFRAKIPLRGRSFLSNRSRYSVIFPPITAIGFDPSRDIHTFRMKL